MTRAGRRTVQDALHAAGLAALVVYVLGVLNDHSTALRQIGFYGAILVALALLALERDSALRLAREPLAKWLAAIALFGAVSALVSPRVAYSAWEAYKELGFLVLSAFATALIVRSARDAEVLMWGSAAAAVDVALYSIAQYAAEFRDSATWPVPDIQLHRYYAEPLLWFLPALFWTMSRISSRWLPAAAAGLVGYLLLLAATGTRGAWYAALIGAAIWFCVEADRARILLATGALAVAVALALWLVPPAIFIEQAMRGLWTAHRVHGAWLPALHLISERPWLGHGYGEEIFHAAYNAEVAVHPAWYFRRSVGPHNVFLALGFAGGLALVGCVAGLLVDYFRFAASIVARRESRWRLTLLATACSVLTYLVIRGWFETLPIRVCGIAFGIALACAAERRPGVDPAPI